jgi:Skp family chaperone for outer membrane proteins
MYLSAALGVAGVMSFAGAAHAQPGAAPAGAPPAASAPAPTRPTIAVFNMAAVMREFGQAKYQVHLLTRKKIDISKRLMEMRAEYIQITQDLQKNPAAPDKDVKEARRLKLVRDIEDEDRKISKDLNESASAIIGDLYDKMKVVVDKTAEMNGYHIVFAYPDAVTAEEMKNPFMKELKLKPPAAQPFYVAPHADITAVVVKTLNTWYPPVDPVTKQVIDVSKLPEQHNPTPSTTPGPGGNPQPGAGAIPGGAPRPGTIPGQR